MKRTLLKRLQAAGLLLAAGAMPLQFLPIGGCRELTEFINPCGTVFAFCDAVDLDFLNRTIPDFQDDPTCTIPFACSPDPIFGNTFGPGPRPSGPP